MLFWFYSSLIFPLTFWRFWEKKPFKISKASWEKYGFRRVPSKAYTIKPCLRTFAFCWGQVWIPIQRKCLFCTVRIPREISQSILSINVCFYGTLRMCNVHFIWISIWVYKFILLESWLEFCKNRCNKKMSEMSEN